MLREHPLFTDLAAASMPNANSPTPAAQRMVTPHRLADLLLDPKNPRFGGLHEGASQNEVAQFIVDQFGVEDVLASLATNGFFQSEPLVAKQVDGKLIVVEGNRRLAACLILADDPRAQALSHLKPDAVSEPWSPDKEVPVMVFDESEEDSLLPYLGVRHIVGSQPWDSFAKARWIDQVVTSGQMTLQEIESAIGDTNRTITRMLDGYRFITQLIDSEKFKPTQSQRRGKGSNTAFPFSWVYTLLDYSNVRDYLGLPPRTAASARPIPAASLAAASKAVTYMFGSDEQAPSIRNSREISDLADALSDPIKRDLLERGEPVSVIAERSRPPSDRLATLMRECEAQLRAANGVLAEGIPPKDAEALVSTSNFIRNLAASLFKGLRDSAYPSNDDE